MSIDRVSDDKSPSLGGNLNAANKNITGVNTLNSKNITSPVSPDVFANNQAVVISHQPSTSPSTKAGAPALVPNNDQVTQIAPHTYAQNGVVFYDATQQGAALAAAHQAQLQGSIGSGFHEPGGPSKPLVPSTNCRNYNTPLTDSDYNQMISRHFRLIDVAVTCGKLQDSNGLTAAQLACRWQNLCTDVLDHIKDRYNFGINSAFRTDAYNQQVASTGNHSDHSVASAADITLHDNQQNIEMWKWLCTSNLPFTQIILYNDGEFIHVGKGAQQSDATRILYSATGKAPYLSGTNIPAKYRP